MRCIADEKDNDIRRNTDGASRYAAENNTQLNMTQTNEKHTTQKIHSSISTYLAEYYCLKHMKPLPNTTPHNTTTQIGRFAAIILRERIHPSLLKSRYGHYVSLLSLVALSIVLLLLVVHPWPLWQLQPILRYHS